MSIPPQLTASMKTYLKQSMKRVLARCGLKVGRFRPGQVSGYHLYEDLRLLLNTDSPICLDVGANEGQTIAHLLETFSHPQIESFEPSPQTYRRLLAQGDIGEKVRLHNFGLGNQNGEAEFIVYDDSCLSSFLPLEQSAENPFREVEERARQLVTVKRLDDFLAEQQIEQVDLLKIDTQGFDFEVLRGAEESLQNGVIQVIQIELNFIPMYEQQSSPQEILQWLADRGMFLIDFYEIVRKGYTIGWCTALFGRRA